MTRRVLVAGGLGFIGSHFVRLLLQSRPDVHVVNVDKVTYAGNPQNLADLSSDSRYRFVRGDIADRSFIDRLFSETRPEVVVNFAAETHVDRSILDPEPFLRTNVEGVQVLLEAARKHPVTRFLQVSTDEVYGDIPAGEDPVDEEAPLRPSSPYAATKAAADHLCYAYARTYGVPVLLVRPSNNYGPYQFPEKLIPLMIRNAVAGETLPVYGDGQQVRDWVYVEETAEAILRVVEAGRLGRAYNISTGRGHPNVEVVRMICQAVADENGRSFDELWSQVCFVEDRPGHDRRYATMATRIREELGWSPRVSLGDGLRRTVAWYISNGSWIEGVVTGEYRRYYETVYARSWGRRPD